MPTFVEPLGVIETEPLLQNLLPADPDGGMIDALRVAFSRGFVVSAEWESAGPFGEAEKRLSRARFELASNYEETLEALRSNKRFVRLILEPKGAKDGGR